jgi:Xaa-Pro aminopeptidase
MPSFDTICAYGPNAAMMHYKATESSNASIESAGFLLIDSGGQYVDGTTDITRTFVMGPVTDEQRQHFTAVLRSVIRLASARFLSGMPGKGLDVLARGPIWDLGIDYRCGTGHGIGFRLNVHEGPNSFRWHESASRGEEAAIVPGMVTTDEPGIYLEGKYGIRTENELLCRVRETNEYGTFLEFETITMAPIDLDGVDPAAMSASEREWLNEYHAEVRRRIMPYMKTNDEREWLARATRSI